MKTFCVLEQGKTINHEITLKKREMFSTAESDFYRLNWQTEKDPNAFITKLDIVWSEGRSLLYEKVPKKYKYYIFIDEDVTFKTGRGVSRIVELLNEYRPLAATFSCDNSWIELGMRKQMRYFPSIIKNLILEREVFPIKYFDLCAHVFSASFAKIAFPVPYHGSSRSMHYAQWICSKLCPGKQICFSNFKIQNTWHEPHQDGLKNGHGHKLVDMFNLDTLDGSFDEREWRNIHYNNLMHSIFNRVDKKERDISLSDLSKIYNINVPGFVGRKPLQD